MAFKGTTGTSTTLVKLKKVKKTDKGAVFCTNCKNLKWGYYCEKQKKSAEWINRPKICRFFIKK